MPAKLSDSQFIERTRQQNRERAERQRQRLQRDGKTALTVWIPATLRTALNKLASERGATIADTAAELLSAALQPAKPTDTRMKSEPDTVDWIAAIGGDISPVTECAPGTLEPARPELNDEQFSDSIRQQAAALLKKREQKVAEHAQKWLSENTDSAPSTIVSVESSRDAIMKEIGELLDAGLSGGEIARRLNAAGKRTATGKEFQGGNIKRDYRKWEQAQ